MDAKAFILDRMQELDRFRFDGLISEADYRDLSTHWRKCLAAIETPVSEWFSRKTA